MSAVVSISHNYNDVPIFFRNSEYLDGTYIIQKASSVKSALKVLKMWNDNLYNVGYTEDENVEPYDYNMLLQDIDNNIDITKSTSDDKTVCVIETKLGNEYYALLKL